MTSVVSKIFISSLLLVIFSLFHQATSLCSIRKGDLSELPTEVDLSQIQDFHLQLFEKLNPADAKTNFIFSPYSVWNALTLAYFGASGQTEEQLRRVLRHGDKLSALKNWKALDDAYKRRPKDYIGSTFISANRVYFDMRIRLRLCVRDLDILLNEVEQIDFTKSQEASNQINDFVSQTTRGTIKELVSPNDVDRARVVLVNAAYFKGVWDKTFNKRDTKPAQFTGLDGTLYSVDMMQQKGRFKFGYNEQLKAKFLELPYSGKSTSMLLFLPYKNTQENFVNMVQGLSQINFEGVISRMILTDIEVDLPKFKLETTVTEELLRTLVAMGITDAFDRSKANFSNFSPDRLISLDKSVQKAFIDVNEEGTEAAAATGFIGTKSGGTSSFECNRPFMFVIRDIETKNILFMGSYKSSDKLDHSHKPSGESDRSTSSFSKNPVYNEEFSPSTNSNPIPHSQGEKSTLFSHGHISSSPGFFFSNLGQNSGSPTFGENGGFISKPNQGSVQNIPPSVVNFVLTPTGSLNHNSDQIFKHDGSANLRPNPNIQSQREDFRKTPIEEIVANPHQNVPSPYHQNVPSPYHQNVPVTNGNSELPGRDIALRPERTISSLGESSDFISDKSVAQSKNRNDPLTDNENSQVHELNHIIFPGNNSVIPERERTQSPVRNPNLFENNSQVSQNKGAAQSSERNSGFVYGRVESQSSIKNPERNIPPFGFNRETNQIPSQNIPSDEDNRNFIPDTEVSQHSNQYSHSPGGNTFLPVNLLPQNPQNPKNNLPVNNDFIPGPQNPERNITPFGLNRETNPVPSQNIPSVYQHSNQYSHSPGGNTFIPSNSLPQIPQYPVNNPPLLPQINGFGTFLQNPVQHFPVNRGTIPGRVTEERSVQNNPSFGESRRFVNNARVQPSQQQSIPLYDRNLQNPNQHFFS